MKLLKRMLNWGIYAKLTATFLIVIIPLYAIGILMNQSGSEIVMKGNYELLSQKSDYVMSNTETEFARIAKLQRELVNDEDLQDLSIRSESLNEYEWTRSVNSLFSKLTVLAASSKYIQEAFVLMPNIQKRLSSNTRLTELDREEFQQLNQLIQPNRSFLRWNGRVYMAVGYPITTRTQYLLVLEISLDNVSKDLDFFKSNTDDDSIYLLDLRHDMVLSNTRIDPDRLNVLRQMELTSRTSQSVSIGGETYLVFLRHSELLDWTLVAMLRENDVMAPVKSFQKWYWVLSILSIAIAVSVSFAIHRLIHRPLQKLIQAFRQVEQGKLDYVVRRRERDEFQYLYEHFNQMVGKLKKLIQEVYEQTIRSQTAELKQLQSQINPHFLYNSLYILYRMAQNEDYEGTAALSKHLGDYFKFLTQSKSDMIPLEQEIYHAQAYSAIQQMRFNNRVTCRFEIDGPYSGWEVPRLIVQPIIENAFIHGMQRISKNGIIETRVRIESSRVTITVTDNGKGMSPEQLAAWETSLVREEDQPDHNNGLRNVHRRLALYYGPGSGLKLMPTEGGGLTVVIVIQTEKEECA